MFSSFKYLVAVAAAESAISAPYLKFLYVWVFVIFVPLFRRSLVPLYIPYTLTFVHIILANDVLAGPRTTCVPRYEY